MKSKRGYLEDWEKFVEEAQIYLLDDWDTNYAGALRFLREHLPS